MAIARTIPSTGPACRDAFLAAVRDIHAELAVPTAADFADVGGRLEPAVLPEERAVLEQAGRWYVAGFGDRPARWDDPGTDQPTDRGGLRVGGWIDLPVRTADDGFELRQFELWGRRVPPTDPLELEAMRVAFLRLTPWLGGAPLRVAWADLVRGLVVERTIEPTERPTTTDWFDERVTIVRDRADDPVARNGTDCGGCAVVSGCPEHRKGAHYGRKGDLLPGILHVTPTGLDTWRRCPREWRDHQLFGIPASDTDPGGVHGQQLHDALHMIHVEGSCHDVEHVGDVLVRRGLDHDDRLWGEIERHGTRCPSPAEAIGHEITRARFSSHPTTPFMATARLDALWVHDGLLDARDFKSGQVWSDRVADDKQARLQAWILAPLADGARPASAHLVRAPRAPRWSTTPSRSSPTPTICSRSRRTCGGGRRDPRDHRLRGRRGSATSVDALPVPFDLPGLRDYPECRCGRRSTPRTTHERTTSSDTGPDALVGVHQAVRALRERSPLQALVHDGRRLPALRAALRA